MLTTLIISACSICYELIISAVSSYLLGNSLLQYSVTIGLYMSALGLGSYLSRFIHKNLFNSLVKIELVIGIVGGFSAVTLFFANLYIELYSVVMYIEIIVIGTLAGAEIPLLTRIIESDEQNLKLTLSSIFSFDYIGALIGSIAFPLLLMPKLGYLGTAFLCGFFNIVAASLIIWQYKQEIKNVRFYKIISFSLALIMLFSMIFANNISFTLENKLYRDDVILNKQTLYQKIVLTKHKDDTRLYINGNCQFSSLDEYRYHEALVHLPISKLKHKNNILILGGGDGLAAREVLKYDIQSIDLVDLDGELVKICTENPQIASINNNSLQSEKVHIIIDDAYEYLKNNEKHYDLIIVDLPDPNSEVLNKLYSNIFYRLCKNSLEQDGILVTQSTSPYYASKAFWCIHKTIASEGFYVQPYHLEVPAFGDWGFNLASVNPLDNNYQITVETRYLTAENIPALFVFGKDEIIKEVEVNRMTKPVLMEYYNDAVANWR